MFKYEPDVYGCISRHGYSITKVDALKRSSAVKGRQAYTLHDEHAAYLASVNIDMDEAQFIGWQNFMILTNGGADWFLMDLRLDDGFTEMECHLKVPATAAIRSGNRWTVSLQLEAMLQP